MTRYVPVGTADGRKMRGVVDIYLAELLKEIPNVTRDGRQGLLHKFADKWDKTGRSYRSLDKKFVQQFFRDYPGIVPSSRNKYVGFVRRFVLFGVDEGWFQAEAARFRVANVSSRPAYEPVRLTAQQMQQMWETESKYGNWYFRGVIAFLAMTLVRQSEAITLRVRDLDMDARRINIIRWKTHDYDDRLPMMPELVDEMRRYLDAYAESIGEPLRPDMYLFPQMSNVFGRRIKVSPYVERDKIGRSLKPRILAILDPQLREEAAKTGRLGAHTLRRSFARALYERLIDKFDNADAIRVVQAMLGHSNIPMTQRYIGASSGRDARDRVILSDGFSMFDETPAVEAKARIYDGDNVVDISARLAAKDAAPAWWQTPEMAEAGIESEDEAKLLLKMAAALKAMQAS